MDLNIHKLLTDKLYDKRKNGAFELEAVIRESVATGDNEKVKKIVQQLCHEYAYAVHQPHARNGGLIGLAAAAIALGSEVAKYLEDIVPPVLACFTDADARVRYYACESMYNIAKVAKGEILVYFNQVFDALCKLAADSELSVKNGAELLDRLIKDIVSESASTFVSVLHGKESGDGSGQTAFSLERFMPLLRDRISVINPFTRMFLVSWITLLDSIPDLELVSHLPSFLGGLFKFLGDPNPDVHTATQAILEKFLNEITKIARLKRKKLDEGDANEDKDSVSSKAPASNPDDDDEDDDSATDSATEASDDDLSANEEDDWIPGQDIQIDYAQILDILVTFLGGASEQEIQLTALKWIDGLFQINPNEIIAILPRLLTQLLPALASDVISVKQMADKVNRALLTSDALAHSPSLSSLQDVALSPTKREPPITDHTDGKDFASSTRSFDLDWEATINALMDHFLNEHELTRAAALEWLTVLHKRAPPGRKLEIDDSTFPALLKTLSDTSETVVSKCLTLLSQISKSSDDIKFGSFMVSLLSLFSTDRKLLETRGNLIIRKLCSELNPERIFRTIADCLEKDDDAEFASIMIQNMNNNLITAPELADLRRRLRNLDSRDGQAFFVALFRSWCHNAVATLSLCLLAQAYEQAYHLLTIFADLEMTLNMLIQIDKLVQLLESPVFTYLRLQLLEPERYPYLYKCLYGLLMLLPQSSAFATLKNRLNAVSAIGYLSTPAARIGSAPPLPSNPSFNSSDVAPRPNRLKSRDDTVGGGIRWSELFEKFRVLQEKQRKRSVALSGPMGEWNRDDPKDSSKGVLVATLGAGTANSSSRPGSGMSGFLGGAGVRGAMPPPPPVKEKSRNPLGFGKFGSGSKKKK